MFKDYSNVVRPRTVFFNFQPPFQFLAHKYERNKRICNQQSFNFVFPRIYLFFCIVIGERDFMHFLAISKPLEKRSKENKNDRLKIFSQEKKISNDIFGISLKSIKNKDH